MLTKSILLGVGLTSVAVYLGLVGFLRLSDTTPPRITLETPFTRVGPSTPLALSIEDQETGLRDVSIRIMQNMETFSLVTRQFPSHGPFSLQAGREHTFHIELTPFATETIPRRRGPATLIVTARDYSWRGFFEGNWQRLEQAFTVKFTPPRLEVATLPPSMQQGGSGVVQYHVSQDAIRSGVQIGEAFFPGYSLPDEFTYFALIAFPYHLPPETPIQLVADDGLGNQAVYPLDIPVKARQWRTRRMTITDRFIQAIVRPVLANTPDIRETGDPLNDFLEVNNRLRQRNAQRLRELAAQTQPEALWEGPFLQLSHSQVQSAFADHREYLYHGQVVDVQDHLGIDLAVTKRYPVEAANHGVVIMAEYFGIYGNTIVIDHGYGLQSLYAHLSSFAVNVGDRVRKGQIIGRSGMTGLAAGDHLHFSLLIHGVQVDPIEWWDPKWVATRISPYLSPRHSIRSLSPAPIGPETKSPPVGF
ncbi:MAG: M23 family metallopeptidase [Nitrospirae bacterium]|nr:MAG: M23 family metallopeptidase [Nitrospirota bacterium]